MKIVKVTSKEELEKLEKIVNEKLELVKTVRDSFGFIWMQTCPNRIL